MSILKVDNIQSTSGTSAISVDGIGRVTFPNQPRLHVLKTGGQTISTTPFINIKNY